MVYYQIYSIVYFCKYVEITSQMHSNEKTLYTWISHWCISFIVNNIRKWNNILREFDPVI